MKMIFARRSHKDRCEDDDAIPIETINLPNGSTA